MADFLFDASAAIGHGRLVNRERGSVSIAQISDCHLFADNRKRGYNDINPYESLASVLTQVKQRQIDTVVCTGDISGDGSPDSYRHFQTLWHDAALNVPLICLAGNHDSPHTWPADWADFNAYQHHRLSERWRLHCIPSEFHGARGTLTAGGIADFHQHMESTAQSNEFHLLALHHPLYLANEWMDKHRLENPQHLLAELDSFSGVKAIINGHVHTARERQYTNQGGQTCDLLACPSTCWQWGTTSSFSVAEQAPGYRIITLNDGGRVHTQVDYVAV